MLYIYILIVAGFHPRHSHWREVSLGSTATHRWNHQELHQRVSNGKTLEILEKSKRIWSDMISSDIIWYHLISDSSVNYGAVECRKWISEIQWNRMRSTCKALGRLPEFQHVSTCFNMFQHVSTNSNYSRIRLSWHIWHVFAFPSWEQTRTWVFQSHLATMSPCLSGTICFLLHPSRHKRLPWSSLVFQFEPHLNLINTSWQLKFKGFAFSWFFNLRHHWSLASAIGFNNSLHAMLQVACSNSLAASGKELWSRLAKIPLR